MIDEVARYVKNLPTISMSNKGGAKFKTTMSPNEFDVFRENGKGLYMWVWGTSYMNAERGFEPLVPKFGEYGTKAEYGSTPQSTIDGYLGTTTDFVIILWAVNFNRSSVKIKKEPYVIEQVVRRTLLSEGVGIYPDGTSTEIYECEPERIIENVNYILYGSKKRLAYPPRDRQIEFINGYVKHRKSGGTDYLLAAIMRWGKNFAWLTANRTLIEDKYLNRESVFLVLTSKPNVFASLEKDINKHVYYKDWDYIELQKEEDRTPDIVNYSNPTVIAISTQLIYNEKSGSEVQKFLEKFHFTDVFIDECHSGTNTENFEKLIKLIKSDHRTWASGTPLKTYVNRGFGDEDSYFYDYIDQQQDKRKDIENGIPNDAVTLKTYIPSIPNSIIKKNSFKDDEQFRITKLLATDKKGKFVFEGDVEHWMTQILNGKAKYSPYRIVSNLNHTVWLLPGNSVASATALSKMLERLTDENTKIINASGNNVKAVSEVLKAVDKFEKSITVTIGRFIEGTTVEPWNACFVLSETTSPERYFQFIFRASSPLKGKDVAYVFDFVPNRTFEMVFEFAKSRAIIQGEKDPKEIIKEWLDNNNIYRNGTGPNFEEVDIEDVMGVINNGDYREHKLHATAKSWINMDNLHKVLSEFLDKTFKKNKAVSTKFSDSELKGGKNYTIKNREKRDINKKDKKDIETAFDNVASIVSSFPMLADLYKVATVSDLLNEVEEDVLYENTHCNLGSVRLLLSENVINEFELNYYL